MPLSTYSPIASLISFFLGMPTAVGAYYQAWKTRQEARQARDGFIFSANCLEYVTRNGTSINLIPLESLHTLPKPGDIVFLPSSGFTGGAEVPPGAFRVDSIEHIYARVEGHGAHDKQARLVKAVALVDSILQ
ncbi:MAG: hypothetical protein WDN23_18925 [Edaphobacter sp.]